MSVKIKLQTIGKRDHISYRIVVVEKRSKRNGKVIDNLGLYDPKVKPAIIKYDRVRMDKWLKNGAEATATVSKILENK